MSIPCYKHNKAPCLQDPKCIWNKRCRNKTDENAEGIEIAPKPVRHRCSGKNKDPCTEDPLCKWIVGMGCKGLDYVPTAKKGCSGKIKKVCEEDDTCQWVIGKGCKGLEYEVPPEEKKEPKPKKECYKKRKDDCLNAPNCKYIAGKGCKELDFEEKQGGCKGLAKTNCLGKVECMWEVKKGCVDRIDESVLSPLNISLLEPEVRELMPGGKTPLLNKILSKNELVELKPIQRKAVEHIIKNEEDFLIVFGTGVGKTLTAIYAAKVFYLLHQDHKVFVICPKNITEYFTNEFKKHAPEMFDRNGGSKIVTFYTSQGFAQTAKDNPGKVCKSNSLVIIDEAHNLRNSKSKAAQIILQCTNKCAQRILMTATPFVNDIKEVYGLIKLLYRHDVKPNKDNWRDMLDKRLIYQAKAKDEHYPRIEERYMWINMFSEFIEKYREHVETQSNAFLGGARRGVNQAGEYNPTISAKMPNILKILQQDPSKKSLIFSNWVGYGSTIVRNFLDEHGIRSLLVSGNTKGSDKIVREFTENKDIQVLMITKAGAEGLDLKNVENVFVLDPPWNQAALDQVMGRAVRYDSHKDLSPRRRVVRVYYVVLKEPWLPNKLDAIEPKSSISGDVLLYQIIVKKKQALREFEQELLELTI